MCDISVVMAPCLLQVKPVFGYVWDHVAGTYKASPLAASDVGADLQRSLRSAVKQRTECKLV
jgi:hypothetical protein